MPGMNTTGVPVTGPDPGLGEEGRGQDPGLVKGPLRISAGQVPAPAAPQSRPQLPGLPPLVLVIAAAILAAVSLSMVLAGPGLHRSTDRDDAARRSVRPDLVVGRPETAWPGLLLSGADVQLVHTGDSAHPHDGCAALYAKYR